MSQSYISSRRLQQIYEGARCSAVERRFLVERLRVSERAFNLLADDRAAAHSAEQFALHLLRGEGLVQRNDSVSSRESSSVPALWGNAKGLLTNAGNRVSGLFAS